jgi:hypothetical protein
MGVYRKTVRRISLRFQFLSLRRYYPDQVLRVDGGAAVLSAGFPQHPFAFTHQK